MTYIRKPYAGITSANYYATEVRKKEFDIRDAGCYVDGSHDDTANFQATINEAVTEGGGTIIVPDTGYACIINGAANAIGTDDTYGQLYGQLYIPAKNFSDQGRVNIKIKGETRPNMVQSAGIGGAVPPNTGSRILSTLVNNTANAFVIASKGPATNFQSFNYNQCDIEDVAIQVTPDSNSKITIGGIGFRDAVNAIIKNVVVSPLNLCLVNSAAPLNNAVGIAMPKVNCEWLCIIENSTVGGFNSGFLTGEHTTILNSIAYCCANGFEIAANNHYAHLARIKSFWNINGIAFTGGNSYIIVDGIQIEWDDLGKWYDSTYTILDANNYGHGKIEYTIVEAGVGHDDSKFSQSGGTHLVCTPIVTP